MASILWPPCETEWGELRMTLSCSNSVFFLFKKLLYLL